jgi:hypothetical protein
LGHDRHNRNSRGIEEAAETYCGELRGTKKKDAPRSLHHRWLLFRGELLTLFLQPPAKHLALDAAEVVNEEYPVEVIDFVLQAHR